MRVQLQSCRSINAESVQAMEVYRPAQDAKAPEGENAEGQGKECRESYFLDDLVVHPLRIAESGNSEFKLPAV